MLPAQQALLLRCTMIKQWFALRKLAAVLDQAQPNLQDRTIVLRLSSTLHTGYCGIFVNVRLPGLACGGASFLAIKSALFGIQNPLLAPETNANASSKGSSQ